MMMMIIIQADPGQMKDNMGVENLLLFEIITIFLFYPIFSLIKIKEMFIHLALPPQTKFCLYNHVCLNLTKIYVTISV